MIFYKIAHLNSHSLNQEKSKRPEACQMFPSEGQIVEWLRGFQDVQVIHKNG